MNWRQVTPPPTVHEAAAVLRLIIEQLALGDLPDTTLAYQAQQLITALGGTADTRAFKSTGACALYLISLILTQPENAP